jgi:protein-disulfide isomerase
VTLVEFSDFQCPFCARFAPTLERILDAYPGQVRLVYRHMPIPSLHPHAQRAAEASLCADEQGAFWEMHDAMFADQRALGADDLKRTARSLGLVGARFDECLDAGVYTERVSADTRVGHELGIQGTPALFINGRFLSGAQPYEIVARMIDEELDRALR